VRAAAGKPAEVPAKKRGMPAVARGIGKFVKKVAPILKKVAKVAPVTRGKPKARGIEAQHGNE